MGGGGHLSSREYSWQKNGKTTVTINTCKTRILYSVGVRRNICLFRNCSEGSVVMWYKTGRGIRYEVRLRGKNNYGWVLLHYFTVKKIYTHTFKQHSFFHLYVIPSIFLFLKQPRQIILNWALGKWTSVMVWAPLASIGLDSGVDGASVVD